MIPRCLVCGSKDVTSSARDLEEVPSDKNYVQYEPISGFRYGCSIHPVKPPRCNKMLGNNYYTYVQLAEFDGRLFLEWKDPMSTGLSTPGTLERFKLLTYMLMYGTSDEQEFASTRLDELYFYDQVRNLPQYKELKIEAKAWLDGETYVAPDTKKTTD